MTAGTVTSAQPARETEDPPRADVPADAFAVTVLFELEDGASELFHRLVADNARLSVALEPGCLRFDVLTPTGAGPSLDVFLYEIYTDPAAFDVHLASDHFKAFDARTRALVRTKTVRTFAVGQNAKP